MQYNYGRKRRIEPMLAQRGSLDELECRDWGAQTKFDGTCIILIKDGKEIVMRGRSWKNDFASRFPEIVVEAKKIKRAQCVGVGELVFYSKKTGKEKFITALAIPETKAEYNAVLEMHDLLYIGKRSMLVFPYFFRYGWLGKIVPKGRHLRVAPIVVGEGQKKAFWKKSCKEGREGIMLKQMAAPYELGTRSRFCLKLKKMYTEGADTADCAVVGVTKGFGRREKNFGALLLAQYVGKDHNLQYVGKTSGFSDDEQKRLFRKLRKLRRNRPAVDPKTVPNSVLFWTKPKVVVEVKFHEMTSDKHYRFPAFIRERTDKPLKDCIL